VALRRLAPQQAAWARTRVLTVGTFDLAHHGHVNLLRSMRAFGRTSVVGIHDDASYALLKGAPPADALAVRMAAIRAHCDTLFVVPHTDPTAALAAIVTREDLARGRCVYVRGDDMAMVPGRPWCEQMRIPIFLLPRSDGVSSSLIKAMASALAPVGGEAAGEGEGRALALALGRLDEAQRPVANEGAGAGKAVVAAAASVAASGEEAAAGVV
jgi:cytidyltransferase-like protein